MLKALKNDIVALEYPINYYISQCIHNGEIPTWFNTWGMGFPLQSNLTWGIFSTPQLLFSSLFDYNIYILHIEFMFFLLLAGWSTFYLLKKYFLKDEQLSQLLAICYMLSGFMVGSTQWLLYITSASFLPLMIISLLKLLYTPSFKSSLQFAVVYTLMFTSAYAAFNIITTYSLFIFIVIWFWLGKGAKKSKFTTFRYFILASLVTLLLCFPCLYYTIEVLNHIERGNSISSDSTFFSSNYLHPSALSNLLLPFSSVKINFYNTEGTMLNTYMGLFILILLPASTWKAIKEKNKPAIIMFSAAVLFLIISFGNTTPLRNFLNILPGFSYFRNPAIFRLYFILSIVLFLGLLYRNIPFTELINWKNISFAKIIPYTIGTLILICFITFILNIKSLTYFSFGSLSTFLKKMNFSQTIAISSLIQLFILIALFFAIKKQRNSFSKLVLTLDLVLNTLICTPFFSVSSYSIKEVSSILYSIPGFPRQQVAVNEVATTYTDGKQNTWNNINVFSKQVSTNKSYRGPLSLSQNSTTGSIILSNDFYNKKLVDYENNSNYGSILIIMQRPTHIRASVNFLETTRVRLMQNYFPGWKAYYNKKELTLIKDNKPGISIEVPKGEGIVDFRYKKKKLVLFASLLHLFVVTYLIMVLTSSLIKRTPVNIL